MNRNSFCIVLLSVAICVFFVSTTHAQGKTVKLTPEEINAANDIAERFITRLDETGDIESLVKEMFVNDFIERYVSEQKNEMLREKEASQDIMFTSGIDYNSDLLKTATVDDWKRLYILTFNIMQYGFVTVLNATAKSTLKGNKPDDDELIKIVSNMFPASFRKLFDAHPILHNYIQKEDKRPIKTIEELRSVNKTLDEGLKLLLAGKNSDKLKMTSDSKKVFKGMKEKMKNLTPSLYADDEESYGFPKGTRIIEIFASVTHRLLIVKIGNEYKIVSAMHGSID